MGVQVATMPPNEQDCGAGTSSGAPLHQELKLSSESDASACGYRVSTPAGPLEERAGQRPTGNEPGEESNRQVLKAGNSDEVIAQDWFYRTLQSALCWYGRVFHDYTVEGTDRVPQSGPFLIVSLHTSHNTDIPVSVFYQQTVTGRVARCFLHHASALLRPWFMRIGCVVGNRKVAKEIMSQGHAGACIPGGVEEAFLHASANGAHAYKLSWESYNGTRKIGFAHVAVSMGAGFTVLPCFNHNGEEMRLNPIYELWTGLRLDSAYGWLMRRMPQPIRAVMWQVAFMGWILACPVSVPVPVKVTGRIGEGVRVREGESAEQLAERVRASFEGLLDEALGEGQRHRSYWRGLQQRWARMSWGRKESCKEL